MSFLRMQESTNEKVTLHSNYAKYWNGEDVGFETASEGEIVSNFIFSPQRSLCALKDSAGMCYCLCLTWN